MKGGIDATAFAARVINNIHPRDLQLQGKRGAYVSISV